MSSRCGNLKYIFLLSQARSLKQFRSLKVSECYRLGCIVKAKFDHNGGEISVVDGNTMLDLPLLKEFNGPNLTIDNTELEANLQYLGENLRILNVDNCSHLRDMIPALLKHDLKNLEYLYISQLGVQVVFQLEAIIANEQENKLFSCLKELKLENLGELQILLCHAGPTHIFSLQNLTTVDVGLCAKLRHLLSSTLARNLWQLKELFIYDCLELQKIIDEDEGHLQLICFPKLRKVIITECPKLKRLFHISVAPSLQKLNSLHILCNDELEKVFQHKDGADIIDYNETVMNELRDLILEILPNLTNFWPAGY